MTVKKKKGEKVQIAKADVYYNTYLEVGYKGPVTVTILSAATKKMTFGWKTSTWKYEYRLITPKNQQLIINTTKPLSFKKGEWYNITIECKELRGAIFRSRRLYDYVVYPAGQSMSEEAQRFLAKKLKESAYRKRRVTYVDF